MKTLALLFSLLTLQAAVAAVGNQDLQAIRKLVADENYEEALKQHLWFHEESKKSAGMGGVRLSFALSQWAELGGKYPKAWEAFKAIRDQHEKTLLAGGGGFAEFHEYSAFNRTLNEGDKTYELFRQLDAKFPDTAARCFHVAMDLVIAKKDYALCGKYLKDPIKRYEDARHSREMNLSLARKNPNMDRPEFTSYSDQTFVTKTCQLIEVMVNLQRVEEAKEIQKRALSYFPDAKIKDALP